MSDAQHLVRARVGDSKRFVPALPPRARTTFHRKARCIALNADLDVCNVRYEQHGASATTTSSTGRNTACICHGLVTSRSAAGPT